MKAELLKLIEDYGDTMAKNDADLADYLHTQIVAMLAQPPGDYPRWTPDNPPPKSMVGKPFWLKFKSDADWYKFAFASWTGTWDRHWSELAGPIPRPGEKPDPEPDRVAKLEEKLRIAEEKHLAASDGTKAFIRIDREDIRLLGIRLAELEAANEQAIAEQVKRINTCGRGVARLRQTTTQDRIEAKAAIAELGKRLEHEHGVACNLSKRVGKLEQPAPAQPEGDGVEPDEPEADAVETAKDAALDGILDCRGAPCQIVNDLVSAVRKADVEGMEVFYIRGHRPNPRQVFKPGQAIQTITANPSTFSDKDQSVYRCVGRVVEEVQP